MRPEKYNQADHEVSPILPGQEESLAIRRSELRDREGSNAQQAFNTINAAEVRPNGSNRDSGGTDLAPEAPKQFTSRIKAKKEAAPIVEAGVMDAPLKGRESLVQSDPSVGDMGKAGWKTKGYAKGPLSKAYKHANLSHTPTATKRKLPIVK